MYKETKLFLALNHVIIMIYIQFLATERIAYICFDQLMKLYASDYSRNGLFQQTPCDEKMFGKVPATNQNQTFPLESNIK